jgi:hypothetical protein
MISCSMALWRLKKDDMTGTINSDGDEVRAECRTQSQNMDATAREWQTVETIDVRAVREGWKTGVGRR